MDPFTTIADTARRASIAEAALDSIERKFRANHSAILAECDGVRRKFSARAGQITARADAARASSVAFDASLAARRQELATLRLQLEQVIEPHMHEANLTRLLLNMPPTSPRLKKQFAETYAAIQSSTGFARIEAFGTLAPALEQIAEAAVKVGSPLVDTSALAAMDAANVYDRFRAAAPADGARMLSDPKTGPLIREESARRLAASAS